MYYCPRCDNLLSEITSGDRLEFRCPTCAENYAATPEATLLMSDNIGEDQASKFRKFIKNAAHDPVNIKVLDECNKCKSKVVTHIRVTDQQKVLHTCKCGNIWEPSYDTIKKVLKKAGVEETPDTALTFPTPTKGIFQTLKEYKLDIRAPVDKFITKRTYHIKNKHRAEFKKMFWKLVDAGVDDIIAIKKLSNYYKSVDVHNNNSNDDNRAEYRIKDIKPWLKGLNGKKYLDIGCSEAGITEAIANYLDIIDKPGYAFATDITLAKGLPTDTSIIFSTNEPNKLKYPDDKFDLITAFMACHHFVYFPQMASEIHRILKPGGIFIIREHDSNDPAFAAFLDFVHLMYATIINDEDDPKCFLEQNKTFYHTREEWTDKLTKYGFKFASYIDSKNPRTGDMDLFKSYYARYKK